jgi:hypothetical protein
MVTRVIQGNLVNLTKRCQKHAVPTAAMKAPLLFGKWLQNVHYAATWKAICRKEGVHKGKDGIEHNWNDDLAEEFTKLLDKDLSRIVNQVLPEMQKEYGGLIEGGINKLAAELKISSLGVAKYISSPLTNLLHNLEGLRVDARREVDRIFASAVKAARRAPQTIPPRLRIAMRPGYTEAAAISGMSTTNPQRLLHYPSSQGTCFANPWKLLGHLSFNRQKDAIEIHIDTIRRTMYKDAAKDFIQALGEMVTLLKGSLKEGFASVSLKIKEHFVKMLDDACKTPRPEDGPLKIELQKEVLEKLSVFDKLLGEFRTKDGEPVILKDAIDLTDMKDDEEEANVDGEDGEGSDDSDASSESDGEEIGEEGEMDNVGLNCTDKMDIEEDGFPRAYTSADYPVDQEKEDHTSANHPVNEETEDHIIDDYTVNEDSGDQV